jgi:hypothetical protein
MHQLARLRARLSFARFRLGFLAVFVLAWVSTPVHGASSDPEFAAGVSNGVVGTYNVTEASGLVASRQNPGVLWTHNDSGSRGSIFALATNGAYFARHYIPDVFTGDFEDISIGPGPMAQFQYIYLGDIGDNSLTRGSIRVFRFPEPAVFDYQSNAPVELPVFGAQEIFLSYPDGPFNAEALMVDPITGDLFITTKQTNTARLYQATRAELDSGFLVTLRFVREVAFRSVSGADISADGSLIANRRPGRIGLWLRKAGQSVGDALAVDPITVPVIGPPTEPNGEAIAFDPNGLGYYTLSEGATQPIYFFARTDTSPPVPRVFVGSGEEWQFNDFGMPLESGWRTNLGGDFTLGVAPLGYGGGEQTPVSFGDAALKYTTTYFLKTFSGSVVASNMALRVIFNDGIAVYLNGVEILRHNLPNDAAYETYANASNTNEARCWFSVPIDPALLRAGENVISAEVHRFDADGSSLVFDLQLVEAKVDSTPHFTSRRITNGIWSAGLRGPNGLRVRIDSSADLRNWSTNRFLILTNGVSALTEPATNRARFFRIGE